MYLINVLIGTAIILFQRVRNGDERKEIETNQKKKRIHCDA